MKSGRFSVIRRNVSHGFRHYKERQRYLYESIVRIPLCVRENEILRPDNSFLQTVTADDLGLNPELPSRLGSNLHATING